MGETLCCHMTTPVFHAPAVVQCLLHLRIPIPVSHSPLRSAQCPDGCPCCMQGSTLHHSQQLMNHCTQAHPVSARAVLAAGDKCNRHAANTGHTAGALSTGVSMCQHRVPPHLLPGSSSRTVDILGTMIHEVLAVCECQILHATRAAIRTPHGPQLSRIYRPVPTLLACNNCCCDFGFSSASFICSLLSAKFSGSCCDMLLLLPSAVCMVTAVLIADCCDCAASAQMSSHENMLQARFDLFRFGCAWFSCLGWMLVLRYEWE